MNVKIVLLNRVIEEEEYVEQPQGFELYQKETLVCRWKKTLYGFKQTWHRASDVQHKRGEKFL
jgi:hypothetical protein